MCGLFVLFARLLYFYFILFFYPSRRSCHMPGSTGPDGKGKKPGFYYHLATIEGYKLCIGLVEASERRGRNSTYGISQALKSNLQTKSFSV